MTKQLGCGSPDGVLEFVFCDDCRLSYNAAECKEFRDSILNLKIGIKDVEEQSR